MSDASDVLTAEDVHDLNRMSMRRTAAFLRIAGLAIVAVGVLAVLGWLWYAVRTQQQLGGIDSLPGFGGGPEDTASWVDRLDVFAPFLGNLVIGAIAVGFGLLLQLVAGFMIDRTGASLTGFEPGDRFTEGTVDRA
jgi:hypothetical protein